MTFGMAKFLSHQEDDIRDIPAVLVDEASQAWSAYGTVLDSFFPKMEARSDTVVLMNSTVPLFDYTTVCIVLSVQCTVTPRAFIEVHSYPAVRVSGWRCSRPTRHMHVGG